jgi:hypothetical protein
MDSNATFSGLLNLSTMPPTNDNPVGPVIVVDI